MGFEVYAQRRYARSIDEELGRPTGRLCSVGVAFSY